MADTDKKKDKAPTKAEVQREVSDAFTAIFGDDFVTVHASDRSDKAEYLMFWSEDGAWEKLSLPELRQKMELFVLEQYPFHVMSEIANEAVKHVLARGIRMRMSEWNRSHNSIPFADGVKSLCLKTGKSIPTPREDHMYIRLPVASPDFESADIEASRLKGFTEQWFEDGKQRKFIQKAVGQFLAGNPERTFLDFYGGGVNGKGSFLMFVQAALGDYYGYIPMEFFNSYKNDPHAAGLVKLNHIRFAMSGEFEQGAKIDTNLLKTITGHDEIEVSEKFGKPWSTSAWCGLVFHSNTVIGVKDLTAGLKQRWHTIICEFTPEPGDMIDSVEMKAIAEAEAAVALKWFAEGLAEYRAEGYGDKGRVEDDTIGYFAGEDFITDIIHENCFSKPGWEIKLSKLLKALKDDNVISHKMTAQSFRKSLADSGFDVHQKRNGNIWVLRGWDKAGVNGRTMNTIEATAEMKGEVVELSSNAKANEYVRKVGLSDADKQRIRSAQNKSK